MSKLETIWIDHPVEFFAFCLVFSGCGGLTRYFFDLFQEDPKGETWPRPRVLILGAFSAIYTGGFMGMWVVCWAQANGWGQWETAFAGGGAGLTGPAIYKQAVHWLKERFRK